MHVIREVCVSGSTHAVRGSRDTAREGLRCSYTPRLLRGMCSLIQPGVQEHREALDGGIPFGGGHWDNPRREQSDRIGPGSPSARA